jgi:SAM-dependent methyltransferase
VENPYCYPDPLDTTTMSFVRESERFRGGWEENEDFVISLAVDRVAAQFGGHARCVDAGAGTGRLTGRFGAVASAVTALELDASRFDRETMLRDAATIGFELTLTAGSAADLDELPQAPFDVVVLSHVIQHAPRDVATTIAMATARALRQFGFLYLSVPVTSEPHDEYVVARVENGRYAEDRVAAAEFDRLCMQSPEGSLATRMFSLRPFVRSLEHAGFHIDSVLAFHFTPRHHAWSRVPCAFEPTGADLRGVVDVAILATRR